MSTQSADALTASLPSGEELLWTGRPRSGIVFRAADVFLIPFSLLWGGFAIFWEASVLTTNAPLFMALWGVPFVLVGLYLIFGRFVVASWQRESTVYGLTPERVIILSGLWGRSIKSLNIETLADVTLTQHADGLGTISLGAAQWSFHNNLQGTGWPGMGQGVPKLDLIENAPEVYEMIREAQRSAKQRR